ncbi:MAG: hypothetical protein OXJ90_29025 [Spirochaetaceae bacterium]|nr:hypothetical protein [Spirochaetaceae bacterium]
MAGVTATAGDKEAEQAEVEAALDSPRGRAPDGACEAWRPAGSERTP